MLALRTVVTTAILVLALTGCRPLVRTVPIISPQRVDDRALCGRVLTREDQRLHVFAGAHLIAPPSWKTRSYPGEMVALRACEGSGYGGRPSQSWVVPLPDEPGEYSYSFGAWWWKGTVVVHPNPTGVVGLPCFDQAECSRAYGAATRFVCPGGGAPCGLAAPRLAIHPLNLVFRQFVPYDGVAPAFPSIERFMDWVRHYNATLDPEVTSFISENLGYGLKVYILSAFDTVIAGAHGFTIQSAPCGGAVRPDEQMLPAQLMLAARDAEVTRRSGCTGLEP